MTLNLSKVREAKTVNESVAALVDEFGRVLSETKGIPGATRDLMTEMSHNRDAMINAVQENLAPESSTTHPNTIQSQQQGGQSTTGDPNRDPVSGLSRTRIREIQPGTPIAVNPYSGQQSKPQVLRADPEGNLHSVAQEVSQHQARAAANDMNQFSSLPSNIGNQKVDGIHKVPAVGPNDNQTVFAASAGTEISPATQSYREQVAKTQENQQQNAQTEQNRVSQENTTNNPDAMPKAQENSATQQPST